MSLLDKIDTCVPFIEWNPNCGLYDKQSLLCHVVYLPWGGVKERFWLILTDLDALYWRVFFFFAFKSVVKLILWMLFVDYLCQSIKGFKWQKKMAEKSHQSSLKWAVTMATLGRHLAPPLVLCNWWVPKEGPLEGKNNYLKSSGTLKADSAALHTYLMMDICGQVRGVLLKMY